ncbi:hypothetical protein [Staphylococcus debuckii]|uniref:hypothetical protein n=1 Tax=Staphylococcus debuckii TaxID=2044912 RepID=UPI000F42E2CC|nr:hypothetical protein [Staphylococcus debuckii]AYU56118.1 hypothetical protein CNQ82_12000 [Staphylococcus debuckii]
MWKLIKGLFIALALVGIYKLWQDDRLLTFIPQMYHQFVDGQFADQVNQWTNEYPFLQKLESFTEHLPSLYDLRHIEISDFTQHNEAKQ